MADLFGEIAARGRIAEDDVLALRKMIYGAPKVTREVVDELFDLDRIDGKKAPEW